jgi:aspartyl-tRNA(Asn)/glutamyl-tRNA(Gln) amidotransferase subunit A
MDSHRAILDLDVHALGGQMRAHELSPVEVTEAYLTRIEATDARLRAYITVTAEVAREQAHAAEHEISAGHWRGPFHGVPIALKDLLYTKGIRTTAGSKILSGLVPDFDATVWTRLREAGAVLLGKLNLHEFAYGGRSANPHYGAVRNPYGFERIAGGSSGGSAAAIVARSAAATIGTDTMGSIRIPAALCGCVGLKPTNSRVSRFGVFPLAYTLDHVGPITRTVRDAALMLQVIAGHDPNDTSSSRRPVPDFTVGLEAGASGMRVGIVRELCSTLSPAVRGSFDKALGVLSSLGAQLEEVSTPSLGYALDAALAILEGDALDVHAHWLKTRGADYGDDVRALASTAFLAPAAQYVRATRARARVLADTLRTMARLDVLVAPTMMVTAPRIADMMADLGGGVSRPVEAVLIPLTSPFDLTGQPVVAVPTALAEDGLPASMQVVGKPFDEGTALRVAHAYEQARGLLPQPAL